MKFLYQLRDMLRNTAPKETQRSQPIFKDIEKWLRDTEELGKIINNAATERRQK